MCVWFLPVDDSKEYREYPEIARKHHFKLVSLPACSQITNSHSLSVYCSVVEEEKEMSVCLEQSVGHVGKCLGREIQRYVCR